MREQAIYNTHSNVVSINNGAECMDNKGNIVAIDEVLVATEIATLQSEALTKHITELVQKHLDTVAQGMRYDNIYTAISYIGDPDTTFHNEGTQLRDWRSAVWIYVNTEVTKVGLGQRTTPSDAELIAELPLVKNY